MIVCICKNVNSTMIQQALDGGAATVECVRNQTGATGCCGKCQFKVNRMVNAHHANTSVSLQDTARSA